MENNGARPRAGHRHNILSHHKPAYPKRRAPVACEVCRSRKSKCDGATPQCGFCKTVGARCNYVALSARNLHEVSSGDDTQARLRALETEVQQLQRTVLVLQLNHQQLQSPPAAATTTTTTTTTTTGMVESEGDTANYNEANEHNGTLCARGIMGNMTVHIDFDMTDYLLELEEEEPPICSPASTSALPVQPELLFDAHLMTAFFEHIHQWYPILDRRAFEAEYLLAGTRPFDRSSRSYLYLMVSAIGALALNLQNRRADDDSKHYAAYAFAMFHLVIADHTLIGAQCLILCAIYHLLSFKPIQAYEYLTSASYKLQNISRRNQGGRNVVVNTELYRRAFYTLYITERELLVQLDLAESGIWTLEESIPLPSGTFENGNTDGPTIVFFLAEIAMNKMMLRTDRNLATKNVIVHQQNEYRFASIVAKELEYQLAEWRRHLPPNIAFPDVGRCSSDLSVYLKLQYNAHLCGINWHALYKAVVLKDDSPDSVAASQKCLRAFYAFVESASDLFSKPVMLSHVSMALASVFTMSLAMLFVRRHKIQIPEWGSGQLEDTLARAVDLLTRYSTIYPAVGHWADILGSELDVLE